MGTSGAVVTGVVVSIAVVDVTVGVTVSALVQVVLDQVVGILSPHPPVMVTPCQALVQVLIDHPLWQIQHLLKWQWRHTARGFGDTVAPRDMQAAGGSRHTTASRDTMGCWGLGTPGSPCAAPQKRWQVCAMLKLCRGEPGAAPAVPVLEALGTHLQVRTWGQRGLGDGGPVGIGTALQCWGGTATQQPLHWMQCPQYRLQCPPRAGLRRGRAVFEGSAVAAVLAVPQAGGAG